MKKVAVVTFVRNGEFFLNRWIDYYSNQFAAESLYIVLEGMDQVAPDDRPGVNFIKLPYVSRSRVAAGKARAFMLSNFASSLFEGYDIVIGVDIDEFLVIDPALGIGLSKYISSLIGLSPISALGLDVVQNTRLEKEMLFDRPFLSQRAFAKISNRYTKASILRSQMEWGPGFHRVKEEESHIDPNLFLFHFGCVDKKQFDIIKNNVSRFARSWSKKMSTRSKVFKEISEANPIDGDLRFATARMEMCRKRFWFSQNMPAPIKKDTIITIPDRFRELV